MFVSYAQNFEDIVLRRALSDVDPGFYVDVGANDPEIDSVTKAFYDAGWRGINVEPVPQWFERLEQERRHDVNLRVAAGREHGEAEFYELVGTGLSTMDEASARRYVAEQGLELRTHRCPVVPLTEICRQHAHGPIHFLKIDVEGGERDVLLGLDLDAIRPWIIVVEATQPGSQLERYRDWETMLTGKDYAFCYQDGLNRFYCATEHARIKDRLATPPNVFDGFRLSGLASHSAHEQLKELRQQLAIREREVLELEGRNRAASDAHAAQIAALRAKADQQRAEARRLSRERQDGLAAMGEQIRQLTARIDRKEQDDAMLRDARSESAELRRQLDIAGRQIVALQQDLGSAVHQSAQMVADLEWARARATEMEQKTHEFWTYADNSRRELEQLRGSVSWRLTSPLRSTAAMVARARAGARAIMHRMRHGLLERFRRVLLHAATFVRTRPGLKRAIIGSLRRFPALDRRVRTLAFANGLAGPVQNKPILRSAQTVDGATFASARNDIIPLPLAEAESADYPEGARRLYRNWSVRLRSG